MSIEFDPTLKQLPRHQRGDAILGDLMYFGLQRFFVNRVSGMLNKIDGNFSSVDIPENQRIVEVPFLNASQVDVAQDETGGEILVTTKGLVRPTRREHETHIEFVRDPKSREITSLHCERSTLSVRQGLVIRTRQFDMDEDGLMTGSLPATSVLHSLSQVLPLHRAAQDYRESIAADQHPAS